MRERPYQKLIVWREAHVLCLHVYALVKLLPDDERFRLVSQMCRSAYSVPMNIAEGHAKRSRKEYLRFIDIAVGSLEELHYQLLLSRDLAYLSFQDFEKAVNQLQKVSYLLMRLRAALIQKSL